MRKRGRQKTTPAFAHRVSVDLRVCSCRLPFASHASAPPPFLFASLPAPAFPLSVPTMVSCGRVAFVCSLLAAAVAIGVMMMRPSAGPADSIAAAAASPPAPLRPALLASFLGAPDVDSALVAAKSFSTLYGSAAYVASLSYLLEHEWSTHPQGVYNLLQHSYMIPSDLRYATLARGLAYKQDPQYQLAAAIGVQFTPKTHLARAPVAELAFRTSLLRHAADHDRDDFLAARAFLAVKERLQHPRDTPFVLALMDSPVAWRNALAWALTRASTAAQPLTSARLLEMITEAKAHDASGELAAQLQADPTAVAWTSYWSARLQSVDASAVSAQAGVALDDHASKTARGEHSKLPQYQEIDIPSYAHLQMGFADGNGQMTPVPTNPPAAAPAAAATSPVQPDKPIRTPASFQPDAVLKGSLDAADQVR